jgi:hypothetical protein
MPSDAEQLATIKSQTLELLRQITAQPKPSYEIDGQQVAWADYLARLQATVSWCDQALASGEPIEVRSRAVAS